MTTRSTPSRSEGVFRSSSRIQVQSDTIESLRRQLNDARNTIRVTERFRQQSSALSEEVVCLREQLRLVTAAAEAADRELARVNASTRVDDQVATERDRALADRDAARVAATREASITKRQREPPTSRVRKVSSSAERAATSQRR